MYLNDMAPDDFIALVKDARAQSEYVGATWEDWKKLASDTLNDCWPTAVTTATTPAENSEDEERRARLFKEAIEGARQDARIMKQESGGIGKPNRCGAPS